mgnify:FL=1
MRTQRQDYRDSTFDEAFRKCDVLQLKYDGWWARIEIVGGHGRVFTQTNRELPKFAFRLQTEPLDAVLVGELMYGTQWSQEPTRYGKIYLFDCWQVGTTPLETMDYRTRYSVMSTLQPRLPPNFHKIHNFRIQDYDKIWKEFVEPELFEGVVFRDSKANVAAPVLRHKNTISDDVLVVGFIAGEGKHDGRLGALATRTTSGITLDVGGGFSDEDREEIWRAQDAYRGRWAQVEGKARFSSGALRHPNFVGWRPAGWTP